MYSQDCHRKTVLVVLALMVAVGVGGCDSSPGSSEQPEEEPPPPVDWSAAADSSTNTGLIDNYWAPQEQYFSTSNQGPPQLFYWGNAHALDVLLDAYRRTGDDTYLDYADQWYEGVKSENSGTFINDYYDDMEWHSLALLRAYQITDEQKYKTSVDNLWEEIKGGWTDVAGGGIMWSKNTPKSKNAISNAPASVLASRLYQMTGQQSYLDWSKKIYNWQKGKLVNPNNGAVWDNVNVENGSEQINKDWIFSYNQGMFLAAALELYEITGDRVYLNDATRAADYALNSLTTSDRLLEENGGGDGGLFNGIFMRYFTHLILEEDLSDATRDRYLTFFQHNAKTLWKEGTNKNEVLYGQSWNNRPGNNAQVDLTVELSGAILIEAAARLESEGMIGGE